MHIAPITALIGLTLREALRRRAPVILAVFAPVLALVAGARPLATPADVPGLVQTAIAVTFAFATLAIVLIGAGFVPRDLKTRTAYLVMTRPITPRGYVAGRALGVAAVAVVLAVAMSAVAWGYIALRMATATADVRSGLVAHRTVDAAPLRFRHTADDLPVRIPPSAGRQRVDGGQGIVAIARFPGAAGRAMRTERGGGEVVTLRITAGVEGPEKYMPLVVLAGDYEAVHRVADREAALVELPAAEAIDGDDIVVRLRPGSPRMAIDFIAERLTVLEPPAPVAANALAETAVLAAALVVTGMLAVMVSTFSGFAVAAVTTLLLVAVGYFSQGLAELLGVYGAAESVTSQSAFDQVLAKIGLVLRPLVNGLRLTIPNLAAYDLSDWFDRSLAVPWSTVAVRVARSAVMAGLFVLVGCFAMSRRETAGRQ